MLIEQRGYLCGMTEKRKREAPISYRPPEALREEFRARVETSGLSVNAFITQAVLGSVPPRQARRPAASQRDIARLLAQTADVHNLLREVSAGSDADTALLEEAVSALREIRAACLQALGRSP